MRYVQNDTPKLSFTVKTWSDGQEVPFDLTGFTVSFQVLKVDESPPKIKATGTCSIDDAAGGKVSLVIPSGAFDTPGRYAVDLVISDGVQSFRLRSEDIRILPEGV